jgi:hypothetical protein
MPPRLRNQSELDFEEESKMSTPLTSASLFQPAQNTAESFRRLLESIEDDQFKKSISKECSRNCCCFICKVGFVAVFPVLAATLMLVRSVVMKSKDKYSVTLCTQNPTIQMCDAVPHLNRACASTNQTENEQILCWIAQDAITALTQQDDLNVNFELDQENLYAQVILVLSNVLSILHR